MQIRTNGVVRNIELIWKSCGLLLREGDTSCTAHTPTPTHIYTHTYTHPHTYPHIHIHLYIPTHLPTYTHTPIHTHTPTHIEILFLFQIHLREHGFETMLVNFFERVHVGFSVMPDNIRHEKILREAALTNRGQ